MTAADEGLVLNGVEGLLIEARPPDGGSKQKIAMNRATSCLKKSGDPDEDRDEEAFFIRASSTLAGTPLRCKRKSLRMALPFPGVTAPVRRPDRPLGIGTTHGGDSAHAGDISGEQPSSR